MIDVPWWAKSPSPYSLIFWIVLALWGMNKLPKKLRKYRFFEAAWIIGLVVLSFDALWCVFQGIFFGYLHPQAITQLMFCFLRDLAGFVLCWIFSYHYFEDGSLKVGYETWMLVMLEVGFMMVWFKMSPDPSFTDWTYAIRMGYEPMRIIIAFIISHVIAKFIQGLIFISMWVRK